MKSLYQSKTIITVALLVLAGWAPVVLDVLSAFDAGEYGVRDAIVYSIIGLVFAALRVVTKEPVQMPTLKR